MNSDLQVWADKTTDRLTRSARFWIGTGMSVDDALARVFSASVAGPKIQAAVRAAVLS
jgi:hypothetical protein